MKRYLNLLAFSVRTVLALYFVPDLFWARRIAQSGADPRLFAYIRPTRSVYLKHLGLGPLTPRHAFLVERYSDVAALVRQAGATFDFRAEKVFIALAGITARVEGAETLYILREIFLEGVYNVAPVAPALVIDIGMNAGIASLFFAAQPNVSRVVAFEPVASTYALAEENYALNPELARKVERRNYGLGATTHSEVFEFPSAHRASAGLIGYQTWAAEVREMVQEPILIVAVADALRDVFAQHGSMPLVMKIDCEGAEYELLRSLRDCGHLVQLDALMVEWHVEGPGEIIEILYEAGFITFSFTPHSTTTGMIYAVRGNSS